MDATARVAPAAARNRGPIAAVLARALPRTATVVEVASGSGEHALWFSAEFPHLTWQPTDGDAAALASIAAWRAAEGGPNLLPPLQLDAAAAEWPVAHADAVVAINMIHIAPWAATCGLMAGAGQILPPGGLLLLYGPFREGGTHTAESNAAFDTDLRSRNHAWGVRDVEAVAVLADSHGLVLEERVAMPANNLSLLFRRR